MISSEKLDDLKNDSKRMYEFIRISNNRDLSIFLKKLGRLRVDFDERPLLELLNHENDNIRYLSVKNLAKLSNDSLLGTYIKIIDSDPSSIVRREAVSAIGRLRKRDTKPILYELLNDPDPEVVLQAIRGLLVFKEDDDVKTELEKLRDHPNEIIQEIIKREIVLNSSVGKDFKHKESPNFMKNAVVCGDARDVLKLVSNESIHLTFTSPPYYNARDYSIYKSYEEYLSFLEEVFKEVHRVTKEGRFFILNTSPIIIPRAGRKYSSKRYPIPYDIHPLIIKMGWEFIDDIIWAKPEASAKNRNAGFLQHRKPLGYKPNPCTEYVMVYRKKTHKLIDWNIKQYDKETIEKSKIKGKYESSNLWKIDPTFDKIHSAVFPLSLCNDIIRFYSFLGDLVFDPFAGSGTFGKSAIELGRYFFLIEKEYKYAARIKENINQAATMFSCNEFATRFLNLKEFESLKIESVK